jgi:hypothetical protein
MRRIIKTINHSKAPGTVVDKLEPSEIPIATEREVSGMGLLVVYVNVDEWDGKLDEPDGGSVTKAPSLSPVVDVKPVTEVTLKGSSGMPVAVACELVCEGLNKLVEDSSPCWVRSSTQFTSSLVDDEVVIRASGVKPSPQALKS